MSIKVPIWVVYCLVPWVLNFLLSLRMGNSRNGGGSFGWVSERDAYWLMTFFPTLAISAIIAAVYFAVTR